jgi:hypothetical protein
MPQYTLTLPTEQAARSAADELAQRGHRLVAVRVVGHFTLDPASWWYGKPSGRPDLAGWWDVFSLLVDEHTEHRAAAETVAVKEIARRHGGFTGGEARGHAETMLRAFTRVGLVHELTEEQAVARRRSLAAAPAVAPRPRPPLAAALVLPRAADERAEMAAIAEVLDPDTDAAEWEDSGELLGELFNSAMHQGTCYPHTASAVPDFVKLARDDRLSDRYRAWVLLDLYMIATVGRRDLHAGSDSGAALGLPAVEAPEAAAARQAVSDAVPRLVERWETEPESILFFLAAIAAACPESDGMCGLAALREAYAGTDRGATLQLIEALETDDPQLIDEAVWEIATWDAEAAELLDTPNSTAEHRGVTLLERLLIDELNRADAGAA